MVQFNIYSTLWNKIRLSNMKVIDEINFAISRHNSNLNSNILVEIGLITQVNI